MNAPIRSDQITAAASPPTQPAFVHLRVRSAYSLLQGALPIPQLAKLAVANKFAALALTDQNNLFGALEFSNKFNSETSKYYQTRDKHLQATSIAAVKSYANLYEEGLSNKKVIKKTVYSIWAIAAGGVLSLILMIMLWLRFVRRKSKMQYELMELIEGL